MNGRMQGSTFTSMISWERKSRNATVAHVLTRLPLLNFNLIWFHFEEWNCIHWSVPDTSVFRRFRSHIFNYACALIKPDLLLSTVFQYASVEAENLILVVRTRWFYSVYIFWCGDSWLGRENPHTSLSSWFTSRE